MKLKLLAVASLLLARVAFADGAVLDINWLADGEVGQAVTIKVNVQVWHNVPTVDYIKYMTLDLSCKNFYPNPTYPPCTPDVNIAYMGDASISGNTCLWPVTTNNKFGGSTGQIKFYGGPLVTNIHKTGQGYDFWEGACTFYFRVAVTALSDTATPDLVNQQSLLLSDKTNGFAVTQTFVHPAGCPLYKHKRRRLIWKPPYSSAGTSVHKNAQ